MNRTLSLQTIRTSWKGKWREGKRSLNFWYEEYAIYGMGYFADEVQMIIIC